MIIGRSAGDSAGEVAPRLLRHESAPFWAAGAVLLAALGVAVDFNTRIDLNVSIIYELPLVLAAASRSRKLMWTLAATLLFVTFYVYSIQGSAEFTLREPFFVDRLLSAMSVLLLAALLHALSMAIEAMEARGRSLDEKNRLLETANQRLNDYRAEITSRNKALDAQRMEAEEASERKTRLLMSVSHDVRTPLTSINLMAELIKRGAGNPDLRVNIPALAQSLQANAQSLGEMVTDVLDISYFDSGRIALRETEFPLGDLVMQECGWLEPIAQAQSLTLQYELPEALVWLCADRVKLGRVLRNLVRNAFQFTDTGGVIVRVERSPDGALLLRVIDTGTGIAPENLEHVFGEFMQLRRPESGDKGGWGLGLAICRRLIRLMGGDVTVESELGRGSIFTVRIPASRVLDRPTLALAEAHPVKTAGDDAP